jgi:HAD superfamily hydrolase (TIGR01549 family)
VRSRITGREVATLDMMRRAHARMGMGIDAARMDELVHLCVDPIRELFHTDPLAVAVVSAIHRAGLKLGIVSNTFFPAFAIDNVLREEGLLDFFPVRIYSSDVGYMKPHPAIFRAALERLNVEASRAIHVGDRLSRDVRGARRAGIPSVWLCKNGSGGSRRDRAGHVIRDLAELPKVLGL